MADPLIECAKERQSVIRFLWSESVKTGDIYGTVMVQYADNCVGQREV
jgi:hypothetical protein